MEGKQHDAYALQYTTGITNTSSIHKVCPVINFIPIPKPRSMSIFYQGVSDADTMSSVYIYHRETCWD